MESSENFDEYMKAVEVGFMTRKIGAIAKPSVTVSVEGDTWSIVSATSLTTHVNKFQLGVEFEETTPDGRKVQTTFTLDGDGKLIQSQVGKVDSVITRELQDNGATMICTCVAKDITCKRVYKRAPAA